jgi:hypothetical protein
VISRVRSFEINEEVDMRVASLSLAVVLFGVGGCAADVSEPLNETTDALAGKHLRYTELDITAGPAGHDGWFPRGLSEEGEVIGQAFDCNADSSVCRQDVVKRRNNGQFSVVAKNFLINDVNSHGDAAGCTFDPVTFQGQAGIVRENGKLELIPPQPGEMSSCVSKVSDAGVAFVTSTDPNFVNSVYIFDHGQKRPFPVLNVDVGGINDQAQLAGTQFNEPNRAYRFDSRTQTTAILPPVSPDPESSGFDINQQGEVLGTSFNFDGSVQRVGKWNRQGKFQTSLVTTPAFIANSVTWNAQGLIVLSNTSDENTYLVPSPGVRLNLADLVKAPLPALQVIAANGRGDIVAASLSDGSALLFRRE